MKKMCSHLKMLCAAIIMLFLVSCGTRETAISPEKEENLRRKELGIKTQTKWHADVINQIQHYDKEGRLVDELWLNPNGVVVNRRVLEYDEKTASHTGTVWYKGRDILKSRYYYHYDNRGNLFEEEWKTPFDDIISRAEYTYQDNKKIKSETYNRFDQLQGTNIYTYEDDLLKDLVQKDRRDRVTNRHQYYYDEEGNLKKEQRFNLRDNSTTTKLYRYEDNKLIEETEYRNDEFVHTLSYEYDSTDMILRETWENEEGNTLLENRYTYDFF
jgi:hypothetical protein